VKHLAVVALLVFVGFAGWRAGGLLSTDAMGMAVGIVFGVLASIPAALLILAASRSKQPDPSAVRPQSSQPPLSPQSTGQMPIVVVAPPAYPASGQPGVNQYAQLPAPQAADWSMQPQSPRPERAFTIVGEQSEYADDW